LKDLSAQLALRRALLASVAAPLRGAVVLVAAAPTDRDGSNGRGWFERPEVEAVLPPEWQSGNHRSGVGGSKGSGGGASSLAAARDAANRAVECLALEAAARAGKARRTTGRGAAARLGAASGPWAPQRAPDRAATEAVAAGDRERRAQVLQRAAQGDAGLDAAAELDVAGASPGGEPAAPTEAAPAATPGVARLAQLAAAQRHERARLDGALAQLAALLRAPMDRQASSKQPRRLPGGPEELTRLELQELRALVDTAASPV